MAGQEQGGGVALAEVKRTRCGCHPETCCCGDYTLWLNGEAVAKGFLDKMQAIADAINAKAAPPIAPVGVEGLAESLRREAYHRRKGHHNGLRNKETARLMDAAANALAQQPADVDGVK